MIPRAVSVLFFKLKATGMMRPYLQSAATNNEGKKDGTELSQTSGNGVVMSIFEVHNRTSISSSLG